MVEAITTKTIATAKTPNESVTVKSAAAKADTQPKDVVREQPINPRLVFDKLSGVVVTEFLNQSGSVILQTPSNAVLAYLRIGLGADGRTVNRADPPSNTSSEQSELSETSRDTEQIFDS